MHLQECDKFACCFPVVDGLLVCFSCLSSAVAWQVPKWQRAFRAVAARFQAIGNEKQARSASAHTVHTYRMAEFCPSLARSKIRRRTGAAF